MSWFHAALSHVHWVATIAFLSVALIQLGFYWFIMGRSAFLKTRQKPGFEGPVSVIICARNECRNLENNLPLVLEQNYPEFEVIVVNDASDDDSEGLLQQMQEKYPELKVITLKESVNFFKGKKLPLSVGIKSASHEHLLLTDADCKPASPHWITRMADHFGDQKKLVLGYGKYERRPGLLNLFIRFDTMFTAMQYVGFALAGSPYMGVGRNLGYTRSLFYGVKGFTSHYTVLSGDDDLFVNQVATSKNTAVELNPHSHTVSEPKTSFRHWFRQKSRHMSTSVYYKGKHKFLLGLFGLTNLIYYPLLLGSVLALPHYLMMYVIPGVFLIKILTQQIVFTRLARRLNEPRLSPYCMLLDMVYPYFQLIFVLASRTTRRNSWK